MEMQNYFEKFFECLQQYEQRNAEFDQPKLFFRNGCDSPLTDFENDSNHLKLATKSTNYKVGTMLNLLLGYMEEECELEIFIAEAIVERLEVDFSMEKSVPEFMAEFMQVLYLQIFIRDMTPEIKVELYSRQDEDWGAPVYVSNKLEDIDIWDLPRIKARFMDYYFINPPVRDFSQHQFNMWANIMSHPNFELEVGCYQLDKNNNELWITYSANLPQFICELDDNHEHLAVLKVQDSVTKQERECTKTEWQLAKEYIMI